MTNEDSLANNCDRVEAQVTSQQSNECNEKVTRAKFPFVHLENPPPARTVHMYIHSFARKVPTTRSVTIQSTVATKRKKKVKIIYNFVPKHEIIREKTEVTVRGHRLPRSRTIVAVLGARPGTIGTKKWEPFLYQMIK